MRTGNALMSGGCHPLGTTRQSRRLKCPQKWSEGKSVGNAIQADVAAESCVEIFLVRRLHRFTQIDLQGRK